MTARVTDFRVWRAGNSVNWNCTVSDIAEETGLLAQTVRASMKRRGWTANARPVPVGPLGTRMPVDFLMKGKFEGHE